MKRLSLILLLSCCLAPQTLALEEAAGAQPDAGKGKPKVLANELDQFVRDAISEGLLTPAGSGEDEPDVEPEEDLQAETVQPRKAAAPLAAEVDCSAAYPLDFSDFREFDRYQQIYTFQEKTSGSGERPAGEADFSLAKAYLSLGLYSEARMVLKSTPGPEAAAYRTLAATMENRTAADVSYFRELASCNDEAGVWLAVALLANDQDEGARRFEDNLNGFRKLPFRLRADIAALVIPQFDKRNEKILPIKLLADFSEEEMQSAPQLQFAKAIVDLGQNNSEGEKTVRAFLNEPQFQEEALAALMRHEKPLNGLYEEILLGELMKKFGQTGNDRALAASLQFALQELSSSSHYQPIMDLATMPALQNDAAQAEIRRQFVNGLSRDLASDNRLRNLAALNALVSDPGILDAAPEKTEFYRSGAALAVRFGLASLTKELMRRDGADDAVAEQLADLEFQRGDYGSVATWARTYPHSAHMALLASMGAIREGDASTLKEFAERIDLDPESVLALIEQDAASGHWMVSTDFYMAAAGLTDSVQKQRAARVFAMRQAARELAAGPAKIEMTKVASVLKRPEEQAGQVTGGAH